MDWPEVLPAAEPCGGHDGLVWAPGRVQALRWLLSLHENSLPRFAARCEQIVDPPA